LNGKFLIFHYKYEKITKKIINLLYLYQFSFKLFNCINHILNLLMIYQLSYLNKFWLEKSRCDILINICPMLCIDANVGNFQNSFEFSSLSVFLVFLSHFYFFAFLPFVFFSFLFTSGRAQLMVANNDTQRGLGESHLCQLQARFRTKLA